MWLYFGTTTGAKAILIGAMHMDKKVVGGPITAEIHNKRLYCNYGTGDSSIYLSSDTEEKCKAVDKDNRDLPDGQFGVAFNCK